MAAQNSRALLVPQRKLRRKLRVLIDARLNLQWTIDQPRLREVVDQQPSVILAITAPGHPADQVVSIGRSEGEDEHKLVLLRLTRQLHQHVIRIDRRGLLLSFLVEGELLRDAPDVFALEKDP